MANERVPLDELRLPKPDPENPGPEPAPVEMRWGPGFVDPLRIDGSGEGPPMVFPMDLLGEAELLFAKGDIDGALALAGAAPDDEKNLSAAITVAVRAHLMQGDLESARAALGNRRQAEGMALADAALLITEGQLEAARRRLKNALAEKPLGLVENYHLSLLQLAEGDVPAAVDTMLHVARSSPDHALARYQLGRLFRATGDVARAGILYEMALELSPDFMPPATELVEILTESGQSGEALSFLQDLGNKAPQALEPRFMQARILIELDQQDVAIQLLKSMQLENPEHPQIRLLIANALSQQGNADEAKEALGPLLSHASTPHRIAAHRLLAQVALQEVPPNLPVATGHLETATEAAPERGDLWLDLAKLRFAAADKEGAIEALKHLTPDMDLGTLLTGASLAKQNAVPDVAEDLGNRALAQVKGTPASVQVEAFLASLQPSSS
jgi:tetratricopeptide (TPR) repeat protein